jgi:hypothetical protein
MSLLLNRQPKAKPRPATGTYRWVVPIGDVGTGVLAINRQEYVVTILRGRDDVVGYRLTKPADGMQYDIDATGTPWRCDCPDAVFQPERPGGCKHVAALRAALAVACKQ